ncbi:MAG: extracellular solute-binding protein [Clostridia bacterium]|nr:extracellular solute-binding protein [Clostridia bacterium]
MKKNITCFFLILFSVSIIIFCYGCISLKETAETDDVVTVNVWLSKDCVEEDVMADIVAEYNAGEGKEKGIKIEYRGYDKSEYEKIFTLVYATNNEPEIMSIPSTYTLDQLQELGWIKPFENVEGGLGAVDAFEEGMWIKDNNKSYALKSHPCAYKLIYNCEIFEKNGIVDENGRAKPPRTWEDVVNYSRIITQNGGGKEYGLVFAMKNSQHFWENNLIIPFEKTLGYYYDGKYDFSVYERAFEEFFLKIRKDGSFYPNPGWIDEENALQLFFEGNVGMKITSSFYDISLYNDSHGQDLRWDIADIPVFDTSDTERADFIYETKNFMYITSAVNVMHNPEKVVEVYTMLHSQRLKDELRKRNRILTAETDTKTVQNNKVKERFSNFGKVIPLRGLENAGAEFYTGDDVCNTFDSIWNSCNGENLKEILDNVSGMCNKKNLARF